MARRRYSRNQYYRNSRYNRGSRGREFALRHIEEANNLSAMLGGTDKKVKAYLFGLDSGTLAKLLDEYGSIHGFNAREYAERTMPRWKSGKTQMSGLVASRIYSLLPPKMPSSLKFSIAEDLWRHVGPRSSKTLRFGPLSSDNEIVDLASSHISSVVNDYSIPSRLQRQFDWLSSNDVQAKQQILNYLQSMDKNLVVEAVRQQVPVMTAHMKQDTMGRTTSFTYQVSVGNHKLLLIADHKSDVVRLEDDRDLSRRSRSGSTRGGSRDSSGYGCLIAVVIGVLLVILVNIL